jgi:hypothetical protein
MNLSCLASDPSRSLSWLSGNATGWAQVDHTFRGIKCLLCGARLKAQTMFDHGMLHLAAAQIEYDALATLISLIASEKRIEDFAEGMKLGAMRTVFESAVDQVFGFRPGTPEALQFWQQHGEQL